MKVFALIALVPLVAGKAGVPFTAFGGVPSHAVHHAAPAHHAVAHAVHAAPVHHAVHHAPAHHVAHHAVAHHAVAHHAVHHDPAYHAPAYHAPKHNCSVVDVVKTAEVCTPAFETVCADVELPIKKIIDVEQCYTVTRTVCTESIEVIPNEI